MEAQFEQFWSAFRDQHRMLEQSLTSNAAAEFMHRHLPISRGILEWEFGPSPDGGNKLVFSIYPNQTNRAMCDRLVELAPAIKGWSFAGYRQPEPLSITQQLVTGRGGIWLGETWFKVQLIPGQCIAIECFASAVGKSPTDMQTVSAQLLIEIVVGEETFEKWVGPVTLKPIPKVGFLFKKFAPPTGCVGIAELKQVVDESVATLVNRLPKTARASIGVSEEIIVKLNELDGETIKRDEQGRALVGYTIEIDPSKVPHRDDYPARDDMLIGSTTEMPLLRATGGHFHSCRFSRVGETFAYLKRNRGLWGANVLEPRAELEDALNEKMQRQGMGVSWGGATGRRYSYIELALTDVPSAIEAIGDVIQASPHKTDAGWLLFHDVTLRDEYVDLVKDEDNPPPRV